MTFGGGNTHTQSHIHSALVVVKIKFIVVAYETQGSDRHLEHQEIKMVWDM